MQNVLLLEDHSETRQWLSEMLQSAFKSVWIHQAASLAQANQLLNKGKYELAVVDLNLPDGTGVDFIRTLKEKSPETYVVVATVFDDDEHLFPALEAGAEGYLLKDLSSDEFIDSLGGIIRGEPPISPSIARKMFRYFHKSAQQAAKPESELSARETEILSLIAKGMNRNETARALNISPNTVASHLKTIYSKLNVSSRAEATLEALRLGLVNTQ
ncbi:MAG: response regulator transcription factor [Gammaproteobacteria bacterium]|jgi:DNA-binding NarL/FixJ family response regulator